MDTPDDLTVTLAKARKIADGLQFACRLPDKTPDFFACGGPAAEEYWSYFTPARISSFLAALEAGANALARHQQVFTDGRGLPLCGGCLCVAPCPDRDVIAEALAKGEAAP